MGIELTLERIERDAEKWRAKSHNFPNLTSDCQGGFPMISSNGWGNDKTSFWWGHLLKGALPYSYRLTFNWVILIMVSIVLEFGRLWQQKWTLILTLIECYQLYINLVYKGQMTEILSSSWTDVVTPGVWTFICVTVV